MSTTTSYTVNFSGESFVLQNIADGAEVMYNIHCVDKKVITIPAGILKELPALVAANFVDGPTVDLYLSAEDGTYENVSKIIGYLKYVGDGYNYDHLYMTEEEEAKWREAEMAKLKQATNDKSNTNLIQRAPVDFGTRKTKEYPPKSEDDKSLEYLAKSMDYMANILASKATPGEEIKLEHTDQVYNDMLFKLADSLGCSLFRDYSLIFVTRLVQRTNLVGKFNDESDQRVVKHFNYAQRYKGSAPLVHGRDIIDPAQLPNAEELAKLRKQYEWVWWQDQQGSKMTPPMVFTPIDIKM